MKNKQSGGVISFVVIAVVLAGLLAGALYFSKHQARVAREGDRTVPDVVVDTKEGKNSKKPDVATRDDVPTGAGTSDEAKKNDPGAPTTQRGEAKPSEAPRVAATGPSEQIPETGPADVFATFIAIVSLSFAGGVALQARRRVARTALR